MVIVYSDNEKSVNEQIQGDTNENHDEDIDDSEGSFEKSFNRINRTRHPMGKNVCIQPKVGRRWKN